MKSLKKWNCYKKYKIDSRKIKIIIKKIDWVFS